MASQQPALSHENFATVREITIDLNGLEVYEAGAILVTLLANPQDGKSDEARGCLHKSLCALALRARFDLDAAWANAPQLIKPIYALRTETEIKRDLRTLKRRLRDRMVAAKMAIALLKEAEMGKLPRFPANITRICDRQTPSSSYACTDRLLSRWWLTDHVRRFVRDQTDTGGNGDPSHRYC